MRWIRPSLVLAIALPLVLPGIAPGQTVTYRDEQGRLIMVDRPEDVPPRFRDSVAAPPERGPRGADPAPGGPAGGEATPAARPPPAPVEAAGSVECRFEWVGEPTRRLEGRRPEVTFEGRVRNTGTGRARGVRVTLKVHRAVDGGLIDEVTRSVSPGDLGPGQEGRFSVTADFEKLNYRDPGRDELSLEASRCEMPSAAERAAAADPVCPVELAGPVAKDIDTRGGRLSVTGTVVNRGDGIARGLDLRWRTYRTLTGELLDEHRVPLGADRLSPGAQARFRHEIDLDVGVRDPSKDEFEVRVSRCLPRDS